MTDEDKSLQEFMRKGSKFIASMRRDLSHLQKEVSKLAHENHKLVIAMKKDQVEQTKILKDMAKTCESAEETLGCVLVAIRQNEFLQTYYPAQNGFPAKKFCGVHPSKLMGKAQ